MADVPVLNRERHIKYWLRCLRSPLPHQYTPNDANRMTLAFFTVASLDLLGALATHVSAAERADAVAWIYHCQHPDGGFRGFPGTDFGSRRNEHNAVWDPANLPATYCAIAALGVLGDDLRRLQRRQCLSWLRRVQRADGSFGETVGENGKVEGGRDARFGYCAAAVRRMLRGEVEGAVDGVPDIDVDALARCVRRSETYDGGISEAPFHEPHAGYAYCAIAALVSIGRLSYLSSRERTVQWLLSRETTDIEDEELTDEDEPAEMTEAFADDMQLHATPTSSFGTTNTDPTPASSVVGGQLPWFAGFHGRVNKIADTCYCFWVGGSLRLLDSLVLADVTAVRRYLLAKTQHPVLGGFSKAPGDPPDLLHSFTGLAALTLMNEAEAEMTRAETKPDPDSLDQDGLPLLCPVLSISRSAASRLDHARAQTFERAGGE